MYVCIYICIYIYICHTNIYVDTEEYIGVYLVGASAASDLVLLFPGHTHPSLSALQLLVYEALSC